MRIFLVSLLFLFPFSAEGAIALVATSSASDGSASSITMSHVVSGSDTVLLCGANVRNGGSDQVSSITYNGDALTRIKHLSFNTDQAGVYLYYRVAPDAGTNNAVVTYTGGNNTVFMCATYSGVDQSFDGTGYDFGSRSGAGTDTLDFTVASNDSAFMAVLGEDDCVSGETFTAGVVKEVLGPCGTSYLVDDITVASGAQSFVLTTTGGKYGWIGVVMSPATGGGGGTPAVVDSNVDRVATSSEVLTTTVLGITALWVILTSFIFTVWMVIIFWRY